MTIAEELALISKKHGDHLDPEVVVEYARDPKTALHQRFTWDDTEAAHQYRLHQARTVIHSIVEKETIEDRVVEVQTYVSLPSDRGEYGYRPLQRVMTDEVLREELLRTAKLELKNMRDKYAKLTELAQIFEAIDKL